MVAWLVPLLIGLALNIVSYLLMPKPKSAKPEAAKDMDDPTAEAGREMMVVFGEVTVKSPNCLWFGEKSSNAYKVKA